MKYALSYVKFDLKAGLAVAAMTLPFSVAYSEMLGLPPETGIFAAVFSLICYFLLGSSNELIIGPDSATTALLASSIFALSGTVQNFNASQFIIAVTITTGLLYFLAGLLRLGFIANFLSQPILIGFLNGVALILIIGQLEKLTGISVESSNSIFGLYDFLRGISSIQPAIFITGISAFIGIKVLKKTDRRIPAEVIILVLGVILVSIFDLGKYGIPLSPEVSGGLPIPVIPDINLFRDHSLKIIRDALAILFLTFTNTVLVGRSFSKDKYNYDANKEFTTMGLADTVCGLFKGFPVSGSSSRTAINISSGAKSKFSMLFASLIMILVVLFLPKQFALIPSAIFAAIIVTAAFSMFNFKELARIRDYNRVEFHISLICTAGVLFIGVLDGIVIAVLLSFLNLIRRSSSPPENELVYDPALEIAQEMNDDNRHLIIDNVLIYRFGAAMLFYNFDYFRKKLTERISSGKEIKTVLIDAGPVNQIDITFCNELSEFIGELYKKGITINFYRANDNFRSHLTKGLSDRNTEHVMFFADINTALTGLPKL